MTKREYFEKIKGIEGVANDAELVAFLDKQIEIVSRKRTTKTKTQIENEGLVEEIYNFMINAEGPVTVADIMGNFNGTLSNQKVSALVKKLVDAEKVAREKDGKTTVYTVIAD